MPYRMSPKNPTHEGPGVLVVSQDHETWVRLGTVHTIVLNGLSFNSGGAQGITRYLFLFLLL